MKKSLVGLVLILFCCAGFLEAGKSYSSGRSSFSSRSSSSRSFGSSSSKSYSAPKISTPKPSYSAPKPSYSAKPSTPSTPSYSSKPSSSSKSYSSNSTPSTTPSTSPSSKPKSSSFGSSMSQGIAKDQSKIKYVASTTPKPSYKTPGPSGVSKPIDPKSPSVQNVRNVVTHERYVTYENRSSGFWGPHYSTPYYYHDNFSPFLMGWLISDAISSNHRAEWIYHHRNEIDDQRYNDLLKKDAKLQAELEALKNSKVAVDPTYAPPEMAGNQDLMYSKEYIDAAYNPQQQVDPTVVEESEGSSYWLLIPFVFLIAGVVIYFLFIREF